MGYRITSHHYDKKFWYIAPPKTGTQAVREMIERLPVEQYVSHPSMLWHMTANDIIGNINIRSEKNKIPKVFHEGNDAFFATVRNPWARALSFYTYQRLKLEERLIAYSSEAASKAFVEKYPSHLFNYEDKASKNVIETIFDKNYQTFEQFILSIEYSRPNTLNVMTSFDQVDAYWNSPEISRVKNFHYYNIHDFVNHIKPHVKTLIFTQENMDVLVEWFGIAFNVPKNKLELKQINVQGVGDKYKDYYSSKMANIIEEHERYIINLVGYKY